MAVPPETGGTGGTGGSGDDDPERLAGLEGSLLDDAEQAADAGRSARADLRALQGRAFVTALPPGLRDHAAVLQRLLDAAEADPRWRTVELEGSLAAGRGDRMSALCLRLGSDPALEEPPLGAAMELVRGLGKVVDALEPRPVPAEPGPPSRAISAELAGGLRLRLRVASAGSLPGREADIVVLHDPDGHVRVAAVPPVAEVTTAQAREWLFTGWWALGEVATDIARGSFLEAVEAMADVRRAVCRLWAVGEGVARPASGLASLVAEPAARTPKGLEVLMPRPLPGDLRTAALSAADLLHQAANHAGRRLGEVPRSGMEPTVRRRLSARR